MKISCPACAAKYSIADEKVQDRLAKIRCRKCGTTIVIDGKVSPPTVSAAGATSEPTQSAPTEVGLGTPGVAPSAGEYSVDMGDNDQRTMDVAQLGQAIAQGAITEDTYVWKDGMADWQRIGDLPELLSQIGGSAAGAMPSAPPAADPFTPRAATAQQHSSAADLFGGIESAGGEEDVTTSAPEPAPAAPVPTAPAATGARNESSVLFSLSALTAGKPAAPAAPAAPAPTFTAPTPAPPMALSTSSREDSGLIDLKALSTAVNAPGGGDAFGGHAAVAPLGLAPPAIGVSPLGGPLGGVNAVPAADDLDISRGRSNKGPMIIGGAILVVGLAAVAVFAMQGGDDKSAATTPTAAETTLAAPTRTQEPAKAEAPKQDEKAAEAVKEEKKAEAEEPTAAPPPTGTAAPAPAPAPVKKTYSKPRSSPSPAPSPAPAAAPAPAPAPAPKPAPAASKPKKCNCKPTDLLCAMKCSTK